MFRVTLIAASGIIVLAGCGGGSDDATDTVPSTDSAVESTVVAVTTPATEPSAESDPAPTTAPTPAPTTPPATDPLPPTGDAECLNGEWLADAAAIQTTVDAMGFPMIVTIGPDSQWTASIHDGTYALTSSVAMSAEMPNGAGMTLNASSTAQMDGTYSVNGNVVQATTISESAQMGDWTATLNGVEIDFPGLEGVGEPPAVSAPGFNGSTFSCTETTLQFQVIGAAIPQLTYTRVG